MGPQRRIVKIQSKVQSQPVQGQSFIIKSHKNNTLQQEIRRVTLFRVTSCNHDSSLLGKKPYWASLLCSLSLRAWRPMHHHHLQLLLQLFWWFCVWSASSDSWLGITSAWHVTDSARAVLLESELWSIMALTLREWFSFPLFFKHLYYTAGKRHSTIW